MTSKVASNDAGQLLPIGEPLPDHTPHAVSVSLPTWQSNVGYEEGDPAIINRMKGGYPRFVFHPLVKRLFTYCEARFAMKDEVCMAFPHIQSAEFARQFMRNRLANPSISVRIAELMIPQSSISVPQSQEDPLLAFGRDNSLYVLLFPQQHFSTAKEFWQHTGEGISSRFAEHCLRLLAEIDVDAPRLPFESSDNPHGPQGGRARYHCNTVAFAAKELEYLKKLKHREMDAFVEERFGRNLDQRVASLIKLMLRKRIAGILTDSDTDQMSPLLKEESTDTLLASISIPSSRNLPVSENHVYLFANGMSSIFHTHRLIMTLRPGLKTVQFGFPYTDTLKIQQKIGPGCHFLGFGDTSDFDKLEAILQSEEIAAVFCEFPSNPLLRSPDLERLQCLAKKHSFLIVVDETIGNFCNTSVLPFADIVVSSLTKIFSGDSNVMGGCAVLNPYSPFLHEMQRILTDGRFYYDNLFSEDAIFLERNSRTFRARIETINRNTEAICDFLVTHPKVESIYYPKFTTHDVYKKYARNAVTPGYGGLFSVVLKTEDMAIRFYDAIEILKELDWAAQFGVPKKLIRISVGVEDREYLLDVFRKAIDSF